MEGLELPTWKSDAATPCTQKVARLLAVLLQTNEL